MRVENGQMSNKRYLVDSAGLTSVAETSVAAMSSKGSINNFRGGDRGHHSGMPGSDYFEMVRQAEYAWNHRME